MLSLPKLMHDYAVQYFIYSKHLEWMLAFLGIKMLIFLWNNDKMRFILERAKVKDSKLACIKIENF